MRTAQCKTCGKDLVVPVCNANPNRFEFCSDHDPGLYVTIEVRTEADFRALSYYTLCCLQDTTHYASPIRGLPIAIARGEFRGTLTVDRLGNFIRFE